MHGEGHTFLPDACDGWRGRRRLRSFPAVHGRIMVELLEPVPKKK